MTCGCSLADSHTETPAGLLDTRCDPERPQTKQWHGKQTPTRNQAIVALLQPGRGGDPEPCAYCRPPAKLVSPDVETLWPHSHAVQRSSHSARRGPERPNLHGT